MQNRTIILIDVIVIMVASVSFTVFTTIISFIIPGEIFMAPVLFVDIIGTTWILPFGISILLATFDHSLSAKIAMGIGFAILAIVVIGMIMEYMYLMDTSIMVS